MQKTLFAAAMVGAQLLSGAAGKAAPAAAHQAMQASAAVVAQAQQAGPQSLYDQLGQQAGQQTPLLILRDGSSIWVCGTSGVSGLR